MVSHTDRVDLHQRHSPSFAKCAQVVNKLCNNTHQACGEPVDERLKKEPQLGRAASYFFGVVVFFGVAFLAGAFLPLVASFFAGCGAVDLTTRPDLVLPSSAGALSSTAGACRHVSVDVNVRLAAARHVRQQVSCEAC